MAEHTALPWWVCVNGTEILGTGPSKREPVVVVADTRFFTGTPSGRERADAAFIVRAVNSHDALLAACEAVVADWETAQPPYRAFGPVVEQCKVAIAQATAPAPAPAGGGGEGAG